MKMNRNNLEPENKTMRNTIFTLLLSGIVLCFMGMSSLIAQNRYHALKFELLDEELPPSGEVSLLEVTDDNGSITGYAFLPINKDLTEFQFVVQIPTDGILKGDSGSSAQGIVAVEGDFENFNFKKVDWPSVTSDVWKFDNGFGETNQMRVTVTVPTASTDPQETSSSEDDLSRELSLNGDGAIETQDWSSHQRAQAEEADEDVTKMFSKPDGV